MLKRLKRWVFASGLVGVFVFGLAGTLRDPWLWSYVGIWWGMTFYAFFSIDEDLARERFHPPTAGADGVALHFVRAVALAHIVVGALDAGRWHWSPVAPGLRAFALFGMVVTFGMFYRAMRENRFFSAVVRVQDDRGHHVIDSGPYSVVRHPGYAGMLLGLPFSGLALGSWIAAGIGVVLSGLMFRRVLFEDAFLKKNLKGYAAYADRVRHRLIPGVW